MTQEARSAACKRDPNEVEALLRQRDLGESVCPADGLRPGQHGWSAARIPPGIKGVNVVQEKGPVGGVPEPGGLPAAPSAANVEWWPLVGVAYRKDGSPSGIIPPPSWWTAWGIARRIGNGSWHPTTGILS